jgi:hypothetical protein
MSAAPGCPYNPPTEAQPIETAPAISTEEPIDEQQEPVSEEPKLKIVTMGERTALTLNTKNRASLRTTIPMFIVRQWNLKPGDDVEWSIEICGNGELVAVVRRTIPAATVDKRSKEVRSKK